MQIREFQTNNSPLVENSWATILAAASVGGSLLLACMFPFAAIATLLAATLPVRKAVLWMSAAWLANQLVGYLVLGYPQTANSFAHGAAIGVTALATFWVANKIFELRGDRSIITAIIAFGGSFIAYEALLFVAALFLGGVQNFVPSIVWMIAQNDILWFLGLGALYLVLNNLLFSQWGEARSLQN